MGWLNCTSTVADVKYQKKWKGNLEDDIFQSLRHIQSNDHDSGFCPEPTFALRGICRAVTEDVDLMHSSERLKKLSEFCFWPGAWNLPHKHLDSIWVRLIQVFEGTIHLAAIAREEKRDTITLYRKDWWLSLTGKWRNLKML